MQEYILDNGLKLLYEYRAGKVTSLCIGFDAGALEEEEKFHLGTAHALEHLISKGSKNRSENQINSELESIFGFENAMTNYPYTIYYGTCLSEDLERAVELYSDLLLNPLFSTKGFKEEVNVILQEIKEWEDDMYRYCESILFRNSFKKRRIRELIVGNKGNIESITLDEIKSFYDNFYFPENCTICVCSPLDSNFIRDIINIYFGSWESHLKKCVHQKSLYEDVRTGVFEEIVPSIAGAKIQYIFDIQNLNDNEFKALLLLNAAFGQGTDSILFNKIRTENALAYEVGSSIKNERGIKLLSISMGTSFENVKKAISITCDTIDKFKCLKGYFTRSKIKALSKSINLKREIKFEKSIEFCKEVVTSELMQRGCKHGVYLNTYSLDDVQEEDIIEVANKIMIKPSIQILTGN